MAVEEALSADIEANSGFKCELTSVSDRGVRKNDGGGANESKWRGFTVRRFRRSTLRKSKSQSGGLCTSVR